MKPPAPEAASDDAAAQTDAAQQPESPPEAEAAPADDTVAHIVWVTPDHADVAPGAMLRTTASQAAELCSGGVARLATPAEVAEHEKHGRPINDLG